MSGAAAQVLSGGRLHLQHGPIDLIIDAEGDRELAFAAAKARFATVLAELMDEIAVLRRHGGPCPRWCRHAHKP